MPDYGQPIENNLHWKSTLDFFKEEVPADEVEDADRKDALKRMKESGTKELADWKAPAPNTTAAEGGHRRRAEDLPAEDETTEVVPDESDFFRNNNEGEGAFDESVPLPKPKVTGPDHPEGPGVPLRDGYTSTDWANMERDDKKVHTAKYPQDPDARPALPYKRPSSSNRAKGIEESLLKLMKGGSIEKVKGEQGHAMSLHPNIPSPSGLPERSPTLSEILAQRKEDAARKAAREATAVAEPTPLSDEEKEQLFAWSGKNPPTAADRAIEEALLKLMKVDEPFVGPLPPNPATTDPKIMETNKNREQRGITPIEYAPDNKGGWAQQHEPLKPQASFSAPQHGPGSEPRGIGTRIRDVAQNTMYATGIKNPANQPVEERARVGRMETVSTGGRDGGQIGQKKVRQAGQVSPGGVIHYPRDRGQYLKSIEKSLIKLMKREDEPPMLYKPHNWKPDESVEGGKLSGNPAVHMGSSPSDFQEQVADSTVDLERRGHSARGIGWGPRSQEEHVQNLGESGAEDELYDDTAPSADVERQAKAGGRTTPDVSEGMFGLPYNRHQMDVIQRIANDPSHEHHETANMILDTISQGGFPVKGRELDMPHHGLSPLSANIPEEEGVHSTEARGTMPTHWAEQRRMGVHNNVEKALLKLMKADEKPTFRATRRELDPFSSEEPITYEPLPSLSGSTPGNMPRTPEESAGDIGSSPTAAERYEGITGQRPTAMPPEMVDAARKVSARRLAQEASPEAIRDRARRDRMDSYTRGALERGTRARAEMEADPSLYQTQSIHGRKLPGTAKSIEASLLKLMKVDESDVRIGGGGPGKEPKFKPMPPVPSNMMDITNPQILDHGAYDEQTGEGSVESDIYHLRPPSESYMPKGRSTSSSLRGERSDAVGDYMAREGGTSEPIDESDPKSTRDYLAATQQQGGFRGPWEERHPAGEYATPGILPYGYPGKEGGVNTEFVPKEDGTGMRSVEPSERTRWERHFTQPENRALYNTSSIEKSLLKLMKGGDTQELNPMEDPPKENKESKALVADGDSKRPKSEVGTNDKMFKKAYPGAPSGDRRRESGAGWQPGEGPEPWGSPSHEEMKRIYQQRMINRRMAPDEHPSQSKDDAAQQRAWGNKIPMEEALENALLKLMKDEEIASRKRDLPPGDSPRPHGSPRNERMREIGEMITSTPGIKTTRPLNVETILPPEKGESKEDWIARTFPESPIEESLFKLMKENYPGGMSEEEWRDVEREHRLGQQQGPLAEGTVQGTPQQLEEEPMSTQRTAGGAKVTGVPAEVVDDPSKFEESRKLHGPKLEDLTNSLLKLMKEGEISPAKVGMPRRNAMKPIENAFPAAQPKAPRGVGANTSPTTAPPPTAHEMEARRPDTDQAGQTANWSAQMFAGDLAGKFNRRFGTGEQDYMADRKRTAEWSDKFENKFPQHSQNGSAPQGDTVSQGFGDSGIKQQQDFQRNTGTMGNMGKPIYSSTKK